jgi:hypothetical protein
VSLFGCAQAWCAYRPDVGYVQGMSHLAALLFMFVEDEAVVFQCFCSLLSRHHLFDFYRLEEVGVAGVRGGPPGDL